MLMQVLWSCPDPYGVRGVEELARSIAYERGQSITEAIGEALAARLNQLGPEKRYDRDYAIIGAAAAIDRGEPVLFKGDDFSQTDCAKVPL